jgi:hypothetical protein
MKTNSISNLCDVLAYRLVSGYKLLGKEVCL